MLSDQVINLGAPIIEAFADGKVIKADGSIE